MSTLADRFPSPPISSTNPGYAGRPEFGCRGLVFIDRDAPKRGSNLHVVTLAVARLVHLDLAAGRAR